MNQYVKLAKYAIEEYIKTGKAIAVPENLPPEFYKKQGGVFVSLHEKGKLRGCIGTYLPFHKNLAEEIIENAVAACSRDHRFRPISAEELQKIDMEVSVLSPPEKIRGFDELDPKKYGVIVRSFDGRSGLLLPNLEGVDSVDEQLSISCQKAGINPTVDKNIEILKFTVKKYSERSNCRENAL